MSIPTDLIGYGAATLTTVSFFPQALKTLRSGDTKAIFPWNVCLFHHRCGALVGLWIAGW